MHEPITLPAAIGSHHSGDQSSQTLAAHFPIIKNTRLMNDIAGDNDGQNFPLTVHDLDSHPLYAGNFRDLWYRVSPDHAMHLLTDTLNRFLHEKPVQGSTGGELQSPFPLVLMRPGI